MSSAQLTKEDEEAAGDEVEVRKEDQDKINKFSRLHQRELLIEEELSTKNVSHTPTVGPCAQQLTSFPRYRRRRRSTTTSPPSSSSPTKTSPSRE